MFKRFGAVVMTAMLWLVAAGQALAQVDTLSPALVDQTVGPGETVTVDKTFHLDALPGAADIIIAIDTTGSMGAAIAQAKAQATQLCNDVQTAIPGARFAVFDFRDVPDRPLTQGVEILTPIFTASCVAVTAAINTMTAGGGGDFPEAYNWVFNKAYNDPLHLDPAAVTLDASRLANAVQFLVVLGDAVPHNSPAPTVAPACGNTPPADAGVDSTREIGGLNAKDITLLMINYGGVLSCYSQLAGATGGTAVNAGGDLSGEIISQIRAAAAHVSNVHLEVVGPCLLDITFSPANIPSGTAPGDFHFTETITAPTAAGDYKCTVQGFADGRPRGNPEVVEIRVIAGPPVKVVVTPPTDTNTVGDEHCVTATVTDAFGNPTPGVTVFFNVPTSPATGADPARGSATTNRAGEARFCWTASLPGVDTVTAVADANGNGRPDPGEPEGAATKIWILPASTAFCDVKVTEGGWIYARNGDRANFGGNARVLESDDVQGQEEYQDKGPAVQMNLHSTKILALTCTTDHQHATIWGEATINGSGTWIFRIDVTDMGSGGSNDSYGIIVSNGYASGQQDLEGGNVTIHKS
jgi:Big-like domain-containing protein